MPDYELKIDLNALEHLGLNLYSNVPAVLSELIANAWDAEAGQVNLDIGSAGGDTTITVRDDGCGMSKVDLNKKFLRVGYQRRKNEQGDRTSRLRRKVMGRKGIGKLSVFSIANHVDIYTKKGDETLGLQLVVEKIREDIENDRNHYPPPIPDIPPQYRVLTETGTIIVLSNLKKRVQSSIDANLRKRIARRFSIFSDDFQVIVDGKRVGMNDRDYFHKLEYALIYGDYDETSFNHLSNDRLERRKNTIEDYDLKGWIGLVKESGSLQEGDDNLNKLTILTRGKVASENILDAFREGGLYTKYLIGELEADFLDLTEAEDIATSSRQDFLRNDERFSGLLAFVEKELKLLSRERARYKEAEGEERAKEIPEINEWFSKLKGDARKSARKLFGRINVIATDEQHRKTLYKYGVLAFEHLHHKEKLNQLDQLDINNLEVAVQLFSELDDIEASWYYEITRNRLEIISKLKEHISEDALERVIQEHIYKHLWLLDPSWDRATETAVMEKTVKAAFDKISKKAGKEEEKGRIDIRYQKSSGKHIIIELKKASVVTETSALIKQVDKYREALRKEAEHANEKHPIETICLVGKDLRDWDPPERKKESEETLRPKNIRVITYQQLIKDAEVSYQNYLEKDKERGRISKLLEAIDVYDHVH